MGKPGKRAFIDNCVIENGFAGNFFFSPAYCHLKAHTGNGGKFIFQN